MILGEEIRNRGGGMALIFTKADLEKIRKDISILRVQVRCQQIAVFTTSITAFLYLGPFV